MIFNKIDITDIIDSLMIQYPETKVSIVLGDSEDGFAMEWRASYKGTSASVILEVMTANAGFIYKQVLAIVKTVTPEKEQNGPKNTIN